METHTCTYTQIYNIAFQDLKLKIFKPVIFLGDLVNPRIFKSILIFDILIHQKAKLLLKKYSKTAEINLLNYPILDCIISLGPT